jgi:hypothetical protein
MAGSFVAVADCRGGTLVNRNITTSAVVAGTAARG